MRTFHLVLPLMAKLLIPLNLKIPSFQVGKFRHFAT